MAHQKRVAYRPNETGLVATAEQLLAAGKQNFESVYGSKTFGSFNLSEDMEAVSQINNYIETTSGEKKMTETKQETKPQVAPSVSEEAIKAAGFQMPAPDTSPIQNAPVIPLGPENKEEKKQEEPPQRELTLEEKLFQLHEFTLKVTGNAPTIQTLLSWKQMHGDLYVLHMGERVFIFRYLKRQEWVQLKANPKYAEFTEMQRNEDLFHRCVLYPVSDSIKEAGLPANTLDMVAEQIKMQSMFLDEMYVASLVLKF